MKMTTLRWALVASALTIGLAACTVTSDTSVDGGAGGAGGATGGSGGATGGSGGATGGSGGATGGAAGSATGGAAGSATGGSAGSATGGTGGAAGSPCDAVTGDNACQTCVKTTCCTELTACSNDTTTDCSGKMACFATCTADPQTCGMSCDPNVESTTFNDLLTCIYFNTSGANCAGSCG